MFNLNQWINITLKPKLSFQNPLIGGWINTRSNYLQLLIRAFALSNNSKLQVFRNVLHSLRFLPFEQSMLKRFFTAMDSVFFKPITDWNINLHDCSSGNYYGGWCSQYADTKQFLQIDLGQVTKITRIAHQGRSDAGWWTKTYTLSYSNDGAKFISYKNDEVNKL